MNANEQKLLACLASPAPKELQQEKIHAFFPHHTDKDRLIDAAVKEGMAALLYKKLQKKNMLRFFSESQMQTLEHYYYTILHTNIGLIRDLKKILNQLNSENIQAALLQGTSLLLTTYKDIGIRPLGDIDIWILKKDFIRLTDILISLGYEQDRLYPGKFIKQSVTLDVHTHLLGADRIRSRDRMLKLSQSHIFEKLQSIDVEGETAYVLDARDQIIFLGLHALKHNISRFIWLVDIMHLLEDLNSNDWHHLIVRAQQLGQEKSLAYILYLVSNLFTVKLPDESFCLLEKIEFGFLEKTALRQKEKKGALPKWAPFVLFSANSGLMNRSGYLFENLFPRPGILRQCIRNSQDLPVWQLYLKRVLQLTGRLIR